MIRKRDAIPEDARKMIKVAASRAGMSVSEWLNAVILDAAADEGVKNLRNVFHDRSDKPKFGSHDFASIYSRLDDIAARIENLSQGNSAFETSGAVLDDRSNIDGEQQQAIFDRLSDLLHMPAPAERPSATIQRRKPAMR